jgi:hypothetical protein
MQRNENLNIDEVTLNREISGFSNFSQAATNNKK